MIYTFKLYFLLSKTHNQTHYTIKLNIILSPKIELKTKKFQELTFGSGSDQKISRICGSDEEL